MSGLRQVGSASLLECIEEGIKSGQGSEQHERRKQRKAAEAVAHVQSALGTTELTPTQKEFAEYRGKALGGANLTKGFGFSIPGVNERKPNWKANG